MEFCIPTPALSLRGGVKNILKKFEKSKKPNRQGYRNHLNQWQELLIRRSLDAATPLNRGGHCQSVDQLAVIFLRGDSVN